ncbi:hypothetical protein SAMN05421823_108247 [Catalinimonas alkaloidigena]|uniref:Glycosyltransferase 2-like domain-containing protein n=1 Tax=Catalinimonas alkaloidigena TaxID=1075417 RepID=A0A1G9NCD6_9BACT|nr:glycosyltransferase family 2 protein [Catalinimonas alkaloidigena]SDL84099.1 hypothetical protein SAMN05421823_108247 [Catalinimonas alkaloidigena]
MPQTAIVILNWNGRHYLQQFLPSVVRHRGDSRVIVVDNASTDDSVAVLTHTFPEVEILQLPTNAGFAGGYNQALQQIEAEVYVLLNSDVEVTEGWLESPLALLRQHPRAAACQPKIRSFHAPDYFEYAGAAGGYIDRLGYPFCRGRLFNTLEQDTGQYDDDREVFWASGACLFIKADAFHAVGGFDEDFFAHMEEIDLCWRLRNLGYRIYYCGRSTVYHVGGGTLERSNPRKTYLNFRNGLTLLLKNVPASQLPFILFTRMVLDGIAGIKFLLTDSLKDTRAILKAHASFYRNVARHWRKRQRINTQPLDVGVLPGSLVWSYFIKGKRRFSQLLP